MEKDSTAVTMYLLETLESLPPHIEEKKLAMSPVLIL